MTESVNIYGGTGLKIWCPSRVLLRDCLERVQGTSSPFLIGFFAHATFLLTALLKIFNIIR